MVGVSEGIGTISLSRYFFFDSVPYWEYRKQIQTVMVTFVPAIFVLVTFVHIMSIFLDPFFWVQPSFEPDFFLDQNF